MNDNHDNLHELHCSFPCLNQLAQHKKKYAKKCSFQYIHTTFHSSGLSHICGADIQNSTMYACKFSLQVESFIEIFARF